jgi:cupin 2 domain-containing protein
MSTVRNLFADLGVPPVGERFETLCGRPGVRIERIVSSAAPEPVLYDQAEDEWVALLRGEAELEVEGELVRLGAGDCLLLPAHARHSLRRVSAGAVWLAVYLPPAEGAAAQT